MFEFFGKARDSQTAAPAEVKASATGRVAAWGTSGRVVWSPRDTVSLTKQGFAANPVGFRAVKLIAEAAAAVPLLLQDRERRYDAHPVLDLIARPNAAQGRAELMEALYGQLLLSGNGYLEAVTAETDLPLTDGFIRTMIFNDFATGETIEDRRRNTSNHEIDLCPLYGRTFEQVMALRTMSEEPELRGKLKSEIVNGEEHPLRLFQPGGDAFVVGHVDLVKGSAKLRRDGLALFFVHVEKRDLAAVGGDHPCGRFAKAGGAAGDDRADA